MSTVAAICGASATIVCVKSPGHDSVCSYNDDAVEIRALRAENERLRAENAELQESLEAITLKIAMLQSSA